MKGRVDSMKKAVKIISRQFNYSNPDEGEPCTFKDRVLLEYAPFKVLEGMIITAFAIDADIDANIGYVYIREEYPKLQRRMNNVIELAKIADLLGDNILGRGFNFK